MRARTLLTAAALLASAACSSLPKPAAAPAPALTQGDAPQLSVWTPSTAFGSISSATFFSVDRDAYAAAFAVTRDGRLRVVWPESPKEDGLVRGGKTYGANANFAQYGSWAGGARSAVPYVFVITSDQRLDLSRFGDGSRWAYQVNLEDIGAGAEDAVASVASVVLPVADAPYAADYAYVGPRVTGQAQMLALNCSIRNVSTRNYSYYRDLWAVFDPWDSYLGPPAFASAWLWSGAWFPFSGRGLSGYYLDRMSRASAAFVGGCPSQFRGSVYPPLVAYGPTVVGQPAPPSQPTDTTAKPGDSLKVKPSEIFGAPGAGVVAAGQAADERRARIRERLLGEREERRRDGVSVAEQRAAFRADRIERLSRVDVDALERRVRAAELAESGRGEAFDRRTGRPLWNDQGFGREATGRAGVASRAAGRSSDGFGASGAGERARSSAERARSTAERSGADRAVVSRGEGGGATRSGDGGARGGGEGRGSGGGEGRSRTP